MKLLLLTSHSIAEYDDVRMFTDMGVDVFSIGAYSDPTQASWLRPALPDAPRHPELEALCDIQREKHAGEDAKDAIDWAKADLHPDLIDWADVIVCHHYLDAWVLAQWPRIRHKRVVWRTCGQSDTRLEDAMGQLRRDGLQIVRYSPKEKEAFVQLGVFAGEDVMIRFGKYPSDYGPWTGEDAVIGNVTQNMVERGDWVGYRWWLEATEGLPAKPAGPPGNPGGPLPPGGVGQLDPDEMRDYLNRVRVYLYTGTNPASYTLGFIEAMMTGIPMISIGARSWGIYAPWQLFEPPDLLFHAYDDPKDQALRHLLLDYLDHPNRTTYGLQRYRAIELFGIDTVAPQWAAFLGVPYWTPPTGDTVADVIRDATGQVVRNYGPAIEALR